LIRAIELRNDREVMTEKHQYEMRKFVYIKESGCDSMEGMGGMISLGCKVERNARTYIYQGIGVQIDSVWVVQAWDDYPY